MRQEIDAAGRLVSASLRRVASEGSVTAELHASRGRLTGSIRSGSSSGATISVDEPADDLLFLPEDLGALRLVIERARSLVVGGTLTLLGKDVAYDPVALVDVKAVVTRRPDDRGERRYSIDDKRPTGDAHLEVTVGADGSFRRLHVENALGEVDFVDRRPE